MRNTISLIGAVLLAVAMVAAQKRPPNYNPASMPETDFDCSDKVIGGYYGDAETECQMFHVCVKVPGIGVQDFRFLCPNDTAFDQENQVCDDWYNIDCAGQTSNPRPNGSRPSPTPIPLGPSTQRPALNGQPQPGAPQGLPPAPRTKPIASNHAGEEDDDFFLQRADTGDRRLHHGTSRDIFKGSQSGNFFNSKNGGKDDDDDYEPDYRPNAFRHSQKAKTTGPLPQFVQQYQQQPKQQPQQQAQPQQAQPQRNNFQQPQQQTTPQRNNFQQPQQTTPQRNNFQQPQQTTPQRNNFQQQQTTQPARQNYQQPQTTPRAVQQQQPQQTTNFPQQDNFNQQRKKKVTVRRKLVQKGSQDQDQYQQYKQQQQQDQYQQQQQQDQQQPRRSEYQDDEEYYRTYQHDQHSNIDSPNQAFGQRGNFPAIRTTIAPITHASTAATQETRGFNTQTQGFASGAPTTAFTAATTTVVDAARNHNYQTKARYNTIQRSRGEQPTTATEYFTSPSTPAPTTAQQKQYSLFYAKQQQQQQQQQTNPPTTQQPFFQQQRGSSPAATTTTAAAANNNNNRFNYNTYRLNGGSTTQSDDYERPEEQEFLKTAHSSNYRASDFNSFNRASINTKDSGSAYNTKAAGNQTTTSVQTTKPSSAFPVYFPTSPRPAPFSPPQTTASPQPRQATSAASSGTSARDNYYSPQNAPRPFSPSPAPNNGSPATSAPSTVAAFNNQFNSRQPSSRASAVAAPATTSAPAPPPKKYTAKVLPNSGSASPTAAAPLKSTASAIKNDYDYAYYDDSDAGAYEYGLDPISDSHFAKTRTDSVKVKSDQQ